MNTQNNFIPGNLESSSLAIARCALNNLADCSTKGLTVATSHVGGQSQISSITVHKGNVGDNLINVYSKTFSWSSPDVVQDIKTAIIDVRKIISTENKRIRLAMPHSKTNNITEPNQARFNESVVLSLSS